MHNDPYNPELNPGKNPELTSENSKEIAPGWEDVAAEADSPDAPPAIGSPESYRSSNSPRRGIIGEDLGALHEYLDDKHKEGAVPPDESDTTDDSDSSEDVQDESPNDITEELSEPEIESCFRDYIESLESEFGNVRNMSNDSLRRQIHEEERSLEHQLSNPDASADHTLHTDLAVRKRAEAVLDNDNDNKTESPIKSSDIDYEDEFKDWAKTVLYDETNLDGMDMKQVTELIRHERPALFCSMLLKVIPKDAMLRIIEMRRPYIDQDNVEDFWLMPKDKFLEWWEQKIQSSNSEKERKKLQKELAEELEVRRMLFGDEGLE